jgi:hypothetical protein
MFRLYNAFITLCSAVVFFNACSPSKKIAIMPEAPVAITAEMPADSTKTSVFLENLLEYTNNLYSD